MLLKNASLTPPQQEWIRAEFGESDAILAPGSWTSALFGEELWVAQSAYVGLWPVDVTAARSLPGRINTGTYARDTSVIVAVLAEKIEFRGVSDEEAVEIWTTLRTLDVAAGAHEDGTHETAELAMILADC